MQGLFTLRGTQTEHRALNAPGVGQIGEPQPAFAWVLSVKCLGTCRPSRSDAAASLGAAGIVIPNHSGTTNPRTGAASDATVSKLLATSYTPPRLKPRLNPAVSGQSKRKPSRQLHAPMVRLSHSFFVDFCFFVNRVLTGSLT